jgi:hypothetical protein
MKITSPPSRRPRTESVLEERRERIVSLIKSLPGVTVAPRGQRGLKFQVSGAVFATFLDDGRTALNCKAARGVNESLVRAAPERFFLPKSVATRGWIGLWLDLPEIDWDEVEELMTNAYRIVAPRKFLARMQ